MKKKIVMSLAAFAFVIGTSVTGFSQNDPSGTGTTNNDTIPGMQTGKSHDTTQGKKMNKRRPTGSDYSTEGRSSSAWGPTDSTRKSKDTIHKSKSKSKIKRDTTQAY